MFHTIKNNFILVSKVPEEKTIYNLKFSSQIDHESTSKMFLPYLLGIKILC